MFVFADELLSFIYLGLIDLKCHCLQSDRSCSDGLCGHSNNCSDTEIAVSMVSGTLHTRTWLYVVYTHIYIYRSTLKMTDIYTCEMCSVKQIRMLISYVRCNSQ